MMVAAMPWTYWMALPLLVGAFMILAGFGAVYLKKVVEPHVLRLDALAASLRASYLAGAGGQFVPVDQVRRYEARHEAIPRATSSAGRSS